ncbi:uncharacterized protein CLUP02_14594 [Colletotrichum lupini]|uniref:Uncharacterized protein n=1 Tax=Colletotrichum lupini TaxID=145971 RepID=A0A9Q8T6J5_9PEZI|nr:uncharacterized protein CLUP02_14594 [Colletotrichum lupini]UQC89066.1 hypothetical protein CLUP02_14594 [Colletotrichum lupini]
MVDTESLIVSYLNVGRAGRPSSGHASAPATGASGYNKSPRAMPISS